MKINRIFGLASAIALLATASCSNDVIDPNKNNGSLNTDGASGAFLSLDFQMPSAQTGGTRSETGKPDSGGTTTTAGTEIGTAGESSVSEALIVIAATEAKPEDGIKEFGFIVAGDVRGNRISPLGTTPDGNKSYRATATVQQENLNTFYAIYGDGNLPEVYVFMFCNPTSELLNMFDGDNTEFGSADWINATCEVIQGKNASSNKNVGIWSDNSFLMNNVKLTTRELPKKLMDWEKYSTVENPFHLSNANTGCEVNVDNSSEYRNRGVILVERSVARFDFKDGSNNNNTYTVLYNIGTDGEILDKQPLVDVQLQKMCLVNMGKSFFYVPRVSDDGRSDGTNFSYCGAEKPWLRGNTGKYTDGNYVVGPNASVFGGAALTKGFSTYFNFPFFEENGSFNNSAMSSTRWDVAKVDDVLKGAKDNYVGSDPNITDSEGNPIKYEQAYHVWRYVTENVIPGNENNQMNGISTGVVFKGRLLGNPADITGYSEDYWDEGSVDNLIACLNNKPFKYTADPNKPTERDHDGLKGDSKNDPILYYIGGRLYMGWRHLRQAAIQASVTVNSIGDLEINRSNSLYKAVFGDGPIPPSIIGEESTPMIYMKSKSESFKIDDPLWEEAQKNEAGEAYAGYKASANYAWSQWALNGKEVGDDATGAQSGDKLKAMRAAVTAAGITIYQSSTDEDMATDDNKKGAGYYCYYYYWNRHNDNGLDGIMGPMEFDVVRNNVYKLSVDKIARLGHPRIPENDPNPPTPTTPDESDEIYLDVRVKIAPWIVRVNSIKF